MAGQPKPFNEPTSKQLRKLTSLAHTHDPSSSYLMLHDGTALAALYHHDGTTEYHRVDRKGHVWPAPLIIPIP